MQSLARSPGRDESPDNLGLLSLPKELQVEIALKLDCRSIVVLLLTCKQFKVLLSSGRSGNAIWSSMARAMLGEPAYRHHIAMLCRCPPNKPTYGLSPTSSSDSSNNSQHTCKPGSPGSSDLASCQPEPDWTLNLTSTPGRPCKCRLNETRATEPPLALNKAWVKHCFQSMTANLFPLVSCLEHQGTVTELPPLQSPSGEVRIMGTTISPGMVPEFKQKLAEWQAREDCYSLSAQVVLAPETSQAVPDPANLQRQIVSLTGLDATPTAASLPAEVQLKGVEVREVPSTDAREHLRGRQMLVACKPIEPWAVVGMFRGYCMGEMEFKRLAHTPPPQVSPAYWEHLTSSYAVGFECFEGRDLVWSTLGYGNALAQVNDPRVDPLKPPPPARALQNPALEARLQQQRVRLVDNANCVVACAYVRGWPFLFLLTRCSVPQGKELMLDYSANYWQHMRRLHAKALEERLRKERGMPPPPPPLPSMPPPVRAAATAKPAAAAAASAPGASAAPSNGSAASSSSVSVGVAGRSAPAVAAAAGTASWGAVTTQVARPTLPVASSAPGSRGASPTSSQVSRGSSSRSDATAMTQLPSQLASGQQQQAQRSSPAAAAAAAASMPTAKGLGLTPGLPPAVMSQQRLRPPLHPAASAPSNPCGLPGAGLGPAQGPAMMGVMQKGCAGSAAAPAAAGVPIATAVSGGGAGPSSGSGPRPQGPPQGWGFSNLALAIARLAAAKMGRPMPQPGEPLPKLTADQLPTTIPLAELPLSLQHALLQLRARKLQQRMAQQQQQEAAAAAGAAGTGDAAASGSGVQAAVLQQQQQPTQQQPQPQQQPQVPQGAAGPSSSSGLAPQNGSDSNDDPMVTE